MNNAGKIVAVGQDNLGEFLAYCQRHGREHDESFLPEGDDFELSQDSQGDLQYPAYLLLDGEKTVGAACLIRTPDFVKARKGRWMIFHALQPDPAWYMLLLNAMLQHAQGLDFLYDFVPEQLQATRAAAGRAVSPAELRAVQRPAALADEAARSRHWLRTGKAAVGRGSEGRGWE